MKILIAGGNGYVGRHVLREFALVGHQVYQLIREETDKEAEWEYVHDSESHDQQYDVIINCARPHWSQYSNQEIADIERALLIKLDKLAKPGALKIHTSGVWLFGHSSELELRQYVHRPLECVSLDVLTIQKAIKRDWKVVYCPSVIYGGDNCQLMRIVADYDHRTADVLLPSCGCNQYVHVEDIARFYLRLVKDNIREPQHFIAEPQGYSPQQFSKLLLQNQWISSIRAFDHTQFLQRFGKDALDYESLHLVLPVSPWFEASRLHRKGERMPRLDFEIMPITWKQTIDLRHRVLWPNKEPVHCELDGDDTALHFGVVCQGEIVSVASIFFDDNGARLRKFATNKHFQKQGVGTALLKYVLQQLKQIDCEYFWCDARETAMSFYQRFGFNPDGERFYKSGVAYYKMGMCLK